VAIFGRRDAEPVSIDSERDRLRAIRIAAEEELGRLRRELTERVAAVELKERELADVLAKARRGAGAAMPAAADSALAHAQVGLAARAQELNRREKELAARERALVKLETDLARRAAGEPPTSEEHLAQIEARLAALQEAERAFARTQAELAAQSDDLARREAALVEQQRSGQTGGGDTGLSRAELDELDERLRRLERETRDASERTFGDGLRKLERKGLRGTPPSA